MELVSIYLKFHEKYLSAIYFSIFKIRTNLYFNKNPFYSYDEMWETTERIDLTDN